jgi:hypothetical protein
VNVPHHYPSGLRLSAASAGDAWCVRSAGRADRIRRCTPVGEGRSGSRRPRIPGANGVPRTGVRSGFAILDGSAELAAIIPIGIRGLPTGVQRWAAERARAGGVPEPPSCPSSQRLAQVEFCLLPSDSVPVCSRGSPAAQPLLTLRRGWVRGWVAGREQDRPARVAAPGATRGGPFSLHTMCAADEVHPRAEVPHPSPPPSLLVEFGSPSP